MEGGEEVNTHFIQLVTSCFKARIIYRKIGTIGSGEVPGTCRQKYPAIDGAGQSGFRAFPGSNAAEGV